jgi:DNA-binding HxlR family transcriptional regulator
MQAIAHNELSELEESVDSQQILSARLGELANDMCVPLETEPAIPLPSLDEDLRHQIRSASDALQQLNHRYAALLRHSSRSLARMTSLFSSFQGQFQEASGPRLKHQTWSCQM